MMELVVKWVEFAVLFAVSLVDADPFGFLFFCFWPNADKTCLWALSFDHCVCWKVGNVPGNCCTNKKALLPEISEVFSLFLTYNLFSHFNLKYWSVEEIKLCSLSFSSMFSQSATSCYSSLLHFKHKSYFIQPTWVRLEELVMTILLQLCCDFTQPLFFFFSVMFLLGCEP